MSRNFGAGTGSRILVDPNVHRRLFRSNPPLVSILTNGVDASRFDVHFNIVFPFKRWSFRLPFSLCLPTKPVYALLLSPIHATHLFYHASPDTKNVYSVAQPMHLNLLACKPDILCHEVQSSVCGVVWCGVRPQTVALSVPGKVRISQYVITLAG